MSSHSRTYRLLFNSALDNLTGAWVVAHEPCDVDGAAVAHGMAVIPIGAGGISSFDKFHCKLTLGFNRY